MVVGAITLYQIRLDNPLFDSGTFCLVPTKKGVVNLDSVLAVKFTRWWYDRISQTQHHERG